MMYFVYDPYTKEKLKTFNIDEARTKLAEVKAKTIANEDYRFTVAKEMVNGNDTTWINVNLDTDPEDHRYHVFNTFTGQHELFTTLSSAKARRLELIEEYCEKSGLNQVASFDDSLPQPISTGTQTL